MLEQKTNEINKLKLDNKNYKNKYDSLINDLNTIIGTVINILNKIEKQ